MSTTNERADDDTEDDADRNDAAVDTDPRNAESDSIAQPPQTMQELLGARSNRNDTEGSTVEHSTSARESNPRTGSSNSRNTPTAPPSGLLQSAEAVSGNLADDAKQAASTTSASDPLPDGPASSTEAAPVPDGAVVGEGIPSQSSEMNTAADSTSSSTTSESIATDPTSSANSTLPEDLPTSETEPDSKSITAAKGKGARTDDSTPSSERQPENVSQPVESLSAIVENPQTEVPRSADGTQNSHAESDAKKDAADSDSSGRGHADGGAGDRSASQAMLGVPANSSGTNGPPTGSSEDAPNSASSASSSPAESLGPKAEAASSAESRAGIADRPTIGAGTEADDGGGKPRADGSAPTSEITASRSGGTSHAESSKSNDGSTPGASRVDHEKFLARLATAVHTARDGGRQLRIRLDPPELGSLQLEVISRDGVLSARLDVETRAAQHTVQKHLGQLREILSQQGNTIERIDVHVDSRQAGHRENGFANGGFQQDRSGEGESRREPRWGMTDVAELESGPRPVGHRATAHLDSLDIRI